MSAPNIGVRFLLAVIALASCLQSCRAPAESNGPLHVEARGRGAAVVLIHGGQLDCRMWDEQLALYAKTCRVVRYDVRGYGQSPPAKSVYSDVDDLSSVLDREHIDRAHLVGLSLGGRIAIDFALTHPERVASLVLAGPGLSGFQWKEDDDARFWALTEAAQSLGPEGVTQLWLEDPLMAPAMEHPEIAKRVHELALDNAHCWLDNPLLGRPLKPRAATRLAELRAPVLLIIGTRDVPSIHAIADKLCAEVRGVRRVDIDGAGHMVNMERPAEFDRAVLQFLAEQTAAPAR